MSPPPSSRGQHRRPCAPRWQHVVLACAVVVLFNMACGGGPLHLVELRAYWGLAPEQFSTRNFAYPEPAPFLFETRDKVHQQFLVQNSQQQNSFFHVKTRLMSDESFEQQLQGSNTMVLSCAHFSPFCREQVMANGLDAAFKYYSAPRFYPNPETLGANIANKQFKNALMARNMHQLMQLSKGKNAELPSVAIVFNATVNVQGTLFSEQLFIPSFPDTLSVIELLKNNSFHSKYYKTRNYGHRVKEIMVISHLHHNMYWHQMVSEFYRIFPVLPYLWAHRDIKVHVGEPFGVPDLTPELMAMVGISSDRIVRGRVDADIVYMTQLIDRDDVPSVGLSTIVRHYLHDILGNSASLEPSIFCNNVNRGEDESVNKNNSTSGTVYHVNILLIKRNPHPKKGRVILNHSALVAALKNLGERYPKKDGLQTEKIIIHVKEHEPAMPRLHVFSLYSKAGNDALILFSFEMGN